MRNVLRAALPLLLLTGVAAWAGDLAQTLTSAADDNKTALKSFASKGCSGLKARPEGLRVLELQFLGGQTARLLVVDVVRHGERLDVSFYTPGSAALTTRSLKVRPGSTPVWMSADNKGFPVAGELKVVPIESAAFAGVRGRDESAACYVARLAQDFVRPRDFADAAEGADVSH